MSRHSSHRDDLMAEMITLSPRLSLRVAGFSVEIVAGRRSDGRWSLFFGGDPVYHFDSDGRLRRAFVQDRIYRSQGTTLARLTRQESAHETVLLRYDLNENELAEFRDRLTSELRCLSVGIQENQSTVHKAEPAEIDFRPELLNLIQVVLNSNCDLAAALKRG